MYLLTDKKNIVHTLYLYALPFVILVIGPLGCAILPKVLGLISDVDFPIPLPMNKSPSEKKSNLFHF